MVLRTGRIPPPGKVASAINNNRANCAVRNARDFADLLGQEPPMAEDAQPGLGL